MHFNNSTTKTMFAKTLKNLDVTKQAIFAHEVKKIADVKITSDSDFQVNMNDLKIALAKI